MEHKSFLWLSVLCFALGDVRDGIGPFFGVWLQSVGWKPDEIGYVMTSGGLVGLLVTAPLGALTDVTRRKRALLAGAVGCIALSCLLVFLAPKVWGAVGSQILQSVAAAAVTPALSSLTLGMAGTGRFAARWGRNEAFTHAGNVATAAVGAWAGYVYGIVGSLYVLFAMTFLAWLALACIDPRTIDFEVARGLDHNMQSDAEKRSVRHLFSDVALVAIAVTVFFFHLGNAALLPLLGQSAVAQFDVNPAVYTAGTMILAQAAMVVAAVASTRYAERHGLGVLFGVALIALPIRGLIAGLWVDAWNIIPVQVLDGVGAGILGVVVPGLCVRVLQGTGHVNLGLGLVLTAQALGASLSSTYAGVVAQRIDYNAAFLALAAAPAVGILIFAIALAELPRLRRALSC